MGLLDIAADACDTAQYVELHDLADDDPSTAPLRAYYEAAWKRGRTKGILHTAELLNVGDLISPLPVAPSGRIISVVAMNDTGGAMQTSCAVHFGDMTAPNNDVITQWSGAAPKKRLFPLAWNERAWDVAVPDASPWEHAKISTFTSERDRPAGALEHPFSGLVVAFSRVDF